MSLVFLEWKYGFCTQLLEPACRKALGYQFRKQKCNEK